MARPVSQSVLGFSSFLWLRRFALTGSPANGRSRASFRARSRIVLVDGLGENATLGLSRCQSLCPGSKWCAKKRGCTGGSIALLTAWREFEEAQQGDEAKLVVLGERAHPRFWRAHSSMSSSSFTEACERARVAVASGLTEEARHRQWYCALCRAPGLRRAELELVLRRLCARWDPERPDALVTAIVSYRHHVADGHVRLVHLPPALVWRCFHASWAACVQRTRSALCALPAGVLWVDMVCLAVHFHWREGGGRLRGAMATHSNVTVPRRLQCGVALAPGA